eukprot:scaffold644_cov168-Ochromonas_danica.AAC.2
MASSSSSSSLSSARHQELLRLARKSRIFWVLQARDKSEAAAATTATVSAKQQSQHSSSSAIPAAVAIEQVLNLLNNIVDDGESIDLDSLMLAVEEEKDDEEQLEEQEESSLLLNSSSSSSYNLFLKKLLHPQAASIVKSIQQFVTQLSGRVREQRMKNSPLRFASSSSTTTSTSFSTSRNNSNHQDTMDNLGKIWSESIWKFLSHCQEQLHSHPLWQAVSEKEWEEEKVHLEKFLFVKLYPILFGIDSEDFLLNQTTYERIASLAFITPEHLDIKSFHHLTTTTTSTTTSNTTSKKGGSGSNNGSHGDGLREVLAKPVAFLEELQDAQCPADKLASLKKCSASIAQLLKELRKDGTLPGADELLPTMILVIKIANPPHIHSHIKFLQRYTPPDKLVSEAGYLLTNFVSAVYFLDNVNAQALTIEPDEFDQKIKLSKQKARQQIARERALQGQGGGSQESAEGGGVEKEWDCNALLAEYRATLKANKTKEFISIHTIK